MRVDVLTPGALELFPRLAAFKGDFYLAGGTGLALQIGHRVSVDFDLFSSAPIPKRLLKEIEETYYPNASREVLISNSNELTIIIAGVKFTFVHYPFPVILPFERIAPVPLLAVKEILASKAYTIGRRGEFKDYVDLYAGLRGGHGSLGEMLALAAEKYGDAFNDRLFLEQLVYLDDVEEAEIRMKSGQAPTKKELVEYFSKLIQNQPA